MNSREQQNARVGLFVVLEGIDGAGTTTQTTKLVAWLIGRGIDAIATREPSTGPVGRLLREILGGAHAPVTPDAVALLFAADRMDHVQREIAPVLARGGVVVSDRYYHSSFAYQTESSAKQWVRTLNERAIRPDITLFVECAAEIAAERRARAGRPTELFDALELQRSVAARYREVCDELAGTEIIRTIDGARSEGDVFTAITAEIEPYLRELTAHEGGVRT